MECKTQLAEPGGSEDPSQLLPLLHSHLTHELDKWKQVGIRRGSELEDMLSCPFCPSLSFFLHLFSTDFEFLSPCVLWII